MVTIAIEYREVVRHVERNGKALHTYTAYGMMFAVLGLVLSVVGVQVEGLDLPYAVVSWFVFSAALIVLITLLVWAVLFNHIEHEAVLEREQAEREAAELSRRTRRRWWQLLTHRSSAAARSE